MKTQKLLLGQYPTPLHRLKNLSDHFGIDLWIKRDDLTGLATGGNKVRKLDYLLYQAMNEDYHRVVTVGSQQSNHCRQTAAACQYLNIECHLVLAGSEPENYQGNLFLSKLYGAQLHFARDKNRQDRVVEVLGELPENDTYFIPVGGSNLRGSFGYIDAVGELKQQCDEQDIIFDSIFVASGSGGTQAGMVLGLEKHQLNAQLQAVRIDKTFGAISIEQNVVNISNEGAEYFGWDKRFSEENIGMLPGYDDAGYAQITGQELNAIHTMLKEEAILLDPVYTGRAFAGLLDQIKKGKLSKGSKVLFWHTGGTSADFYYRDELLGKS